MRADGWRVRVEHDTTFTYQEPVRASYNEVRQLPRTNNRQTALEGRIHTTPHAAQYGYLDYWQNQATAFNVDGLHGELTIRSSCLVETDIAPQPSGADWDAVAQTAERHFELVAPTRYTASDDEMLRAAQGLRRSSPMLTIEALIGWVHDALGYVRGTTDVHTSATEAYAAGSGVCQDFAHLSLAMLRANGIPARYVSGYLHPDPDAEIGQPVIGESHAWVEAWAGGWWGFDPSNDTAIGTRHVVVARGRDYADVPPVKGVYAGSAGHSASVRVTVTRVL